MDFMKIKERLLPAVKNSGFRMEGYHVWCGSAIQGDDGRYYLFAARWKEETGFPGGYMKNSEIVLAVTESLDKPFRFERVVIGKRPRGYWDSVMAHNPFVIKIKDEYVMFYIGTPDGRPETRSIGYAVSKNLSDGWVRSEKPISLPPNANNPAVLVQKNGEVLLYFRDGDLKVSVAAAKTYDGEFTVLKHDLFPEGMVEDMFVFKAGDHFEMLAEDAEGVYTGIKKAGVHFVSQNAIDWKICDDALAYDFHVEYSDGTSVCLQRRERPMLLFDQKDIYLFTAAKVNGFSQLEGGETWNMVQKLGSEENRPNNGE